MTKAHNFNPRGNVFVAYDEKGYCEDCIDVTIIDCDGEMTEHSLSIQEAKDIALVLLQQADVAEKAKAAKDEDDSE